MSPSLHPAALTPCSDPSVLSGQLDPALLLGGHGGSQTPHRHRRVLPAGLLLVGIPMTVSALGFTSAGIAAGSVAAKMMSAAAIANGGGVAAGSSVAVLQSIGERGGRGAELCWAHPWRVPRGYVL